MKKPAIHINASELNIPDEWTEYLWDLFKPRLEALITEKVGTSGQTVDEYMPLDWFLKTYIQVGTRQTFSKIIKNKVHSFRQGRCKVYNVEHFKKALQSYKPVKPFIKTFVRAVS